MNNCTLANNVAGGDGGGIDSVNSTSGGRIVVANCTISGNTSYYDGGVCNFNSTGGTITLTNCSVSGNTGENGGAGGISNYNQGIITLTNCTISGNTAQSEGGGVYNSNDSGTIMMVGCNIINNIVQSVTTYAGGGGVENLNDHEGNITLSNCTVSGNTAINEVGGGIYNFNFSSGKITLTNCTAIGNTAAGGGGFWNENYNLHTSGTITITNCTVSGNAADNGYGGGVDNFNNTGGIITLSNCIFYQDTGGEVSNTSYSTANAIATYSDIQSGYPGTGNIDKDPLFVNASAGNLHLKPGSPCLGAGTPNGAPATDKDGNPRPNPPSMGAYELAAPPATLTGFTLTPNQIAAPGPTVTANVTVTGNFTKVTVSPAPGSLSIATPTFNLTTNSGGGWGGSFPTGFLKLAKTNPVTFIATGTRADGSTTQLSAPLIIGALPTLSLSLSPDQTAIHRNQTFNLKGFVSDLATVPAPNATVRITLPTGINYVSSNGFTYDAATSTLTLAVSPLAANGGLYPISVMLQASLNAPKQTPLIMSATASCTGFQQAIQNPSVVVEAGLAPLGVDVDATGGFGILDGTADVDLSQGNSPLHATLTPVTSLTNILKIFGDTHRLSIWTEVTTKTFGATCSPTGSPAAVFLANAGLMSPSVSPAYAATFSNLASSVRVQVSFTPRSAGLTFMDAMLTYLATRTNKPIPTVDTVVSVWDDASQLSAFLTATNAFAKSPPKNQYQFFQDVALASKAIVTMSGPEKSILLKILLKNNIIDDTYTIEALQYNLNIVFGINSLLHMYGDWETLQIATSGSPMEVYFNASPTKTQSVNNQSAKGKNIVSKIAARN